jgi:group I intron endonuclease
MTIETPTIWSLYRITNKINNKVYIGQAADVFKRWHDHRRAVKLNKPTQVIHHAMIKYGIDNFEFEVIACCKNQDDANYTETELVKQYNSFVKNGGYNATLGGMNAPKTEEWKKKLSAHWADPEYKKRVGAVISQATLGLVRTEEAKQKMSKSKSGIGNPNWGKKQSKETINKRVNKLQGKKRTGEQKNTMRNSALKRITPIRIKTTSQQDYEIQKKFTSGISQRTLAREYNLSREVIRRILGIKRKTSNKLI